MGEGRMSIQRWRKVKGWMEVSEARAHRNTEINQTSNLFKAVREASDGRIRSTIRVWFALRWEGSDGVYMSL